MLVDIKTTGLISFKLETYNIYEIQLFSLSFHEFKIHKKN